MKLSVHIPTYARPRTMERCLDHLARADLPALAEILVGLDGPESETPTPRIPDALAQCTRILRTPRSGMSGVRHRLFEISTGDIILWLNDDAYAHPDLLQQHLGMHSDTPARVVGGRARWMPVESPTLFDRLVHQTDLLFFRQPRDRENAPYQTTCRNCYGLNLSFPREFAAASGGIPAVNEIYGYDDIELVHRLAGAGAEVWREPRAIVTHDHRFTPEDVHRREYMLGRTAWHYAGCCPEFTRALFGRDICADAELDYARASMLRERPDAERIERSFLGLADQPPDAVPDATLQMLCEHWIPLKRYLWRWGLTDAAENSPPRWSLLGSES